MYHTIEIDHGDICMGFVGVVLQRWNNDSHIQGMTLYRLKMRFHHIDA